MTPPPCSSMLSRARWRRSSTVHVRRRDADDGDVETAVARHRVERREGHLAPRSPVTPNQHSASAGSAALISSLRSSDRLLVVAPELLAHRRQQPVGEVGARRATRSGRTAPREARGSARPRRSRRCTVQRPSPRVGDPPVEVVEVGDSESAWAVRSSSQRGDDAARAATPRRPPGCRGRTGSTAGRAAAWSRRRPGAAACRRRRGAAR